MSSGPLFLYAYILAFVSYVSQKVICKIDIFLDHNVMLWSCHTDIGSESVSGSVSTFVSYMYVYVY
jgi:hypothetical protein